MRYFFVSLFALLGLNNFGQTYFTIHSAQDTLVVSQGQSATFNISATPYSGFSSSLFLSATAEPCDLNYSFGPSILNSPYTNSNFTINNTASIRPDTFDLVVKAENGAYSAYDTCVLVVTYNPGIKWAFFNPGNSALSYAKVYSLMEDNLNNDMWIANSNSSASALSRFNGYSWETFNSTGDHFITDMCGNSVWDSAGSPINGASWISCIYIDSTKIWVGFNSYQVRCFRRSDYSLIVDTVLNGTVLQKIVKDNNGNMWFAGRYSNLWKYNGSSWTHYNGLNSPINNEVWTIAMDKPHNRLWVGTYSGGLVSFDGTFWSVYNSSNSPIPNNYVESMTTDADGNAIVYGQGALYKFDGTSLLKNYGTSAGVPLQVDSSTIWLGPKSPGSLQAFDTGATIVSPDNFGVPVIDFSTTLVHDMTMDGLGNVWIGTEHGLVVYNKDGLESIFNSPRELYSPLVSVADHALSKNGISENFLYPNPTMGKVNLSLTLNNAMPLTFKLMDSRGIIVKTWKMNSVAGYQDVSLDFSEFASGLYHITISSPGFIRSQKLILSK
jgi:hypothetical protein